MVQSESRIYTKLLLQMCPKITAFSLLFRILYTSVFDVMTYSKNVILLRIFWYFGVVCGVFCETKEETCDTCLRIRKCKYLKKIRVQKNPSTAEKNPSIHKKKSEYILGSEYNSPPCLILDLHFELSTMPDTIQLKFNSVSFD